MHHLKTLTLRDFDRPETLNMTLQLIEAPALQQFKITDICTDLLGDPQDFSSTFDLLAGTGSRRPMFPVVEELTVAYINASTDSIERWISSHRQVKSLKVVIPRRPVPPRFVPDDHLALHLLRAFLPAPVRAADNLPELHDSPVCPLLQDLTTSGISKSFLIRFASARRTEGVPLQSIRCDSKDMVKASGLEYFQSEGVKVEEYEESEYEDDDSSDGSEEEDDESE